MSPIALVHAFGAGLLFAIGLGVSGMTDPAKVVGFLDVAGRWDPSLGLVMGGAILVHLPFLRWVRRQAAPWAAPRFLTPDRKNIDAPLVIGSVLFGIGWALSGLCPGPALVVASAGSPGALLFAATMGFGMWLWQVTLEPGGTADPRPLTGQIPDLTAAAHERDAAGDDRNDG